LNRRRRISRCRIWRSNRASSQAQPCQRNTEQLGLQIIANMNTTKEFVVHNDISLSEPPCKRQRTDNSSSDIDSVGNSSNPPVRDEQYYMESEGADCVILAGNVLFKVRLYSQYRLDCRIPLGPEQYLRYIGLSYARTPPPLATCSLFLPDAELTVFLFQEKALATKTLSSYKKKQTISVLCYGVYIHCQFCFTLSALSIVTYFKRRSVPEIFSIIRALQET
jgi:hypothetical protein